MQVRIHVLYHRSWFSLRSRKVTNFRGKEKEKKTAVEGRGEAAKGFENQQCRPGDNRGGVIFMITPGHHQVKTLNVCGVGVYEVYKRSGVL